jgi:hypothetical protein
MQQLFQLRVDLAFSCFKYKRVSLLRRVLISEVQSELTLGKMVNLLTAVIYECLLIS